MKRLKQILALVALCCFTWEVSAQQGNFIFGLESWGGYTSNGTVPFWLRSNQYGSVPLDGASLSLIGFARKDFEPGKEKLFDWGGSFEGRANIGQGSSLTLIEGFGKVRLGIFELRAGRSKKITGLCDTTLTSGSWAISGNSLGIPEIELAVRDFWTFPWLGELFAFKGNFSHGWMGDLQMARFILLDTLTLRSYLHQKSLYGRFGKPSWRVKFYAGFNHQVVWGSERDYYLEDYILTPWETYLYVITGKRFSNGYIQQERQGNHLGSIDLGLEFELSGVKILLYRQNLYEVGGLAHLANIQDGLNGLLIENIQQERRKTGWSKFLFEFLYTKNQAGRPWSPEYGSPYEPYYNHGQYLTGWSFDGTGLGNPFISTREYLRQELPAHPDDYFVNNRIIAFHLAGTGAIKDVNVKFKASWSWNFGTYHTTDEEQSTDITDPGSIGIFGRKEQFSAFIEMDKKMSNNVGVGLTGAADIGALYYNSAGIFIRLTYLFR
jgi:hypothetical protein